MKEVNVNITDMLELFKSVCFNYVNRRSRYCHKKNIEDTKVVIRNINLRWTYNTRTKWNIRKCKQWSTKHFTAN